MEIDTKSARQFAEIVNCRGLPTPHGRDYEEVFGPYHLADDDDNHKQFLSCDRLGHRWSVKGTQAEKNPLGLVGLSTIEIAEVTERLGELRNLERPLLADAEKRQSGRMFIYRGWLFQWVYSPGLMRWELAIHGRA